MLSPFWKIASRDIAFGLHSKIPTCCIAFFILEWSHISGGLYAEKYFKKIRRISRAREKKKLFGIDYIPCPDCLESHNFSNVHKCVKGCGTQYRPGTNNLPFRKFASRL